MFSNFVRRLRRHLVNGATGLLDNAQTHHTIEARNDLEEAFDGNYYFVPPYSPHLKPIEKGFKLVKEYLKQINEDEALLNPINFINRAFTLFSIGGERNISINSSHSCC